MSFMWIPPAGADPSAWRRPGPVVLRPSGSPTTLRHTLGQLSTSGLECAWACTTKELARGVPPQRRGALVELRVQILDEVERRSVRRYRRWLRQGGPRARPSQKGLVVLG
jgi:hypothetical protein